MNNKRRHSRAEAGFDMDVEINGRSYPLTTRNISMKGVLATPNPDMEAGETCELRIRLAPAVKIVVEGCVVRADQESTALEFTSMDSDSFSLLHRLMQWNTADAERIDEELLHPISPEE